MNQVPEVKHIHEIEYMVLSGRKYGEREGGKDGDHQGLEYQAKF